MGILATTLSAYRYRSFDSYELELDPGVTILSGHNAAGKTNLIEALQILTSGQSFRRPSPRDLVLNGEGAGRIELALEGDGRVLDMACDLAPGKRSFKRNGKPTSASGVRGVLPSILFCPDHLDMVKRSAAVRRAALDGFGIQLNDRYAKLVSTYERAVEQRNNLLKEDRPDPALLAAWDESLVSIGSALLRHRIALLDRVRAHLAAVCAAIAPGERADAEYVSTVGDAAHDRGGIEDLFRAALERARPDERRRRLTLVGPHRDEILFTIDGRPARDFGSQGQQRSVVLSWKIAEVQVTHDILGRYPLLLLDDVMSELDAGRREAVVSFIEGQIQTVITTANLGYFSPRLLEPAKVVRVGGERR